MIWKTKLYHIQTLLADELDNCKGKENKYAEIYIKEIQETYRQDNVELKKLVADGKEQIQEEEVFFIQTIQCQLIKAKDSRTYICLR